MSINQNNVYVGSKEIQVCDENKNINYKVLVHYPTNEISKDTAFGPYIMDVSIDATIKEGKYPLIMLSHGSGGSHILYYTITTYLAQKGFIVAMVEHFGNNRFNNELENSEENLILRPKHISIAIDKLIDDSCFGKHINTEKITVIGHSMGGFTALALAGGIPRTREAKIIEVNSDTRIKAIVLLAPASGWFYQGLDNVRIPILMLTAEQDPFVPEETIKLVIDGVPDRTQITHRQVPKAGHFSFLIPFPDELTNPNFIPSTDPEGFDRKKFHQELPIEVYEFLKNL